MGRLKREDDQRIAQKQEALKRSMKIMEQKSEDNSPKQFRTKRKYKDVHSESRNLLEVNSERERQSPPHPKYPMNPNQDYDSHGTYNRNRNPSSRRDHHHQ